MISSKKFGVETKFLLAKGFFSLKNEEAILDKLKLKYYFAFFQKNTDAFFI